jgi:hypothetical protein
LIWNLDDVDDATVVKAHMNRWSNEPSDKVIIDPAELEPTGPPAARAISGELRIPLARGTREQVVTRPMTPESVQIPWPSGLERRSREDQDTQRERAPERRSREDQDTLRERSALERDPIAVLRAWPHSTGTVTEPPARPAGALPSRRRRRVQDKIMLAHLALDLYQELDQLQAIVQHADDVCLSDTEAAPCGDPRCAATTDMLRGALVEACLLVQRVAMAPPAERTDIEDRIHELLAVLHQ